MCSSDLEYLAGWNRIHGTTHVSLRFANVYGPRQDSGLEGGVVSIFLERLARGEPTTIYGDGSQTRDFVYVGDIVGSPRARRSRKIETTPPSSPESCRGP